MTTRKWFTRRRDDERGATLILTALSMVMLLGSAAMGVDVGFTVYGSRTAQAMADTAALDLVQNIGTIDAQSSGTAEQTYINGLLTGVDTDNSSNAVLSATPGLWSNGTFQPAVGYCAGTVFSTPPNACNAIEVTAKQTVPLPFWGGFNTLTGHSGQTTSSTIAVQQPESGFSIGSYLTAINTQQTAVLNVLLGAMATSATVTAVGYQGMANTYINFNQIITASGGLLTDSNVMTAALSPGDWQTIWNDAVANQVAQLSCGSSPTPMPCNASTGLSDIGTFSGSSSISLCQLISVDGSGTGSACGSASPPPSLSTSALKANVNLLQMLTTEAELANGSSALNVTSALGITGVTSANLYLTLVQPAQVAYGPVGTQTSATPCPAASGSTSTCAMTAQVQADLQLNIPVLGLLDIPLSAAVGYATLNSVTCTNNVFNNAQINVSTTAATANVTLAGTNISTLTIGGVSNKSGSFSTVPPTASTVSAKTNPRSFGSSAPTLSYSPSPPSSVLTLLTSTLQPVLGAILQVSGATIGGAQVADLSARCDAIQIVQ